ncbi:heme o synthase [Phenylobacterium soli]|uniref:Protoheme IX farnesyltransferase n=1 Tax=Phenylobacterium soli TaxID=2170551 RepID=A0A328AL96_9CAUL|nr:heme o synthase [Phenylobacterium soli]RAK54184.1 protoheme IX farnesyltransferase [Phenylobacterium soli]
MAMATAHSPSRAPSRWQDYVQLLKPRVMSLVVFTALTGLVCADRPVHPVLAAVAILCIAVGAGASGALNMWYDADIDAKMRRTRGRPVPAGRVQGADALALGVVLSLFSVMLMGMALNWFAAGLLAFTILFYAVIYTMWLKRSTAQNIVIGGLAGALPPVIGWAAATGSAPLNAWLLCAIIFFWTPPHFWALSLYTSEDYAKAGVPMMPVVAGAASTRRQILMYSLLVIPICIAPAFTGLGGAAYLAVSGLGGLVFILLAWRLFRSHAGEAGGQRNTDGLYDVRAGAKDARNLFAFSILYLALIFATLLAEHLMGAKPLELLSL